MVSNWVIVGVRLDSQFLFGPLNPRPPPPRSRPRPQAALRGASHLDLEAQRAAEKAALERKWRQEEDAAAHDRSMTEEGTGAGADGDAPPVENFSNRWILTGISFDDAVSDAAVGLALAPAGADGGSDGGGAADVPRLVATGPCSQMVSAALERFNAALRAAQDALDGAAGGNQKYQVTILPRPPGAAMPLGQLQLRQRKPSETDPLLVQEMLETFHSFTIGLAIDPPAAAGGGAAAPLGPLAVAALDLDPQLRGAVVKAHTAMSEYTAAQAAEWRRQIRVMYEEGAAAAANGHGRVNGGGGGGLADDDGEAASEVATSEVLSGLGLGAEAEDTTRRGQYNGLALTTGMYGTACVRRM
jgi:hypothetical protein